MLKSEAHQEKRPDPLSSYWDFSLTAPVIIYCESSEKSEAHVLQSPAWCFRKGRGLSFHFLSSRFKNTSYCTSLILSLAFIWLKATRVAKRPRPFLASAILHPQCPVSSCPQNIRIREIRGRL